MVVDKVAPQSSDAAKIRFMGTDPPISGKRAGVPVLIFVRSFRIRICATDSNAAKRRAIFMTQICKSDRRLQLDITVESDLAPSCAPQPTLGSRARPSQYLSCIATFPVGIPNLEDASSDVSSLELLTFDPTDVAEGERLDFLCCHCECR
jgi:hypothetical protein